jgi:hypothetical protein
MILDGGFGPGAAGQMVAQGAGKASMAGGRMAKEFAPDRAGAALGGALGGTALPWLGHVAGAKLGARYAANAFGRGKGIRSRTSTALKGVRKGSAPVETIKKPGMSAAEHAERVQRMLLEGAG